MKQQFNNQQEKDQKSINYQKNHNENILKEQSSQNFQQKYHNNEFQQTLQLQDESPVGLTILPQNQTNQILQLDLFPNQKIYIRGKILYSNAKTTRIQKKGRQGDLISYFKQLYSSRGFLMKKIQNVEDHIVYLGINSQGGKILVIDNYVYGDQMYFKKNNLIMSTVNHENGIIKNHPNLSGFQNWVKVNQSSSIQRTIIGLQSAKNAFIVQKYLAPNQNLYVKQELLLCLSSTIKVTKQILGGKLVPCTLTGPGWVFLQNNVQPDQVKVTSKFSILSLFIFIIVLGKLFEYFNI